MKGGSNWSDFYEIARFGVSRKEQDEFAVRSHQNAANAHKEGLYANEMIPVNGSVEENGIRGDSTYEKLASMRAAFVKPHGTHTAANSSFLTDGKWSMSFVITYAYYHRRRCCCITHV